MPERIVALAGSLRRASYNRALIRAARELAPDGMVIEEIEIGALPSTTRMSRPRETPHRSPYIRKRSGEPTAY
jgi:NAD(P)H-dependent FMN reductase